jgi:hypothetical protein
VALRLHCRPKAFQIWYITPPTTKAHKGQKGQPVPNSRKGATEISAVTSTVPTVLLSNARQQLATRLKSVFLIDLVSIRETAYNSKMQ